MLKKLKLFRRKQANDPISPRAMKHIQHLEKIVQTDSNTVCALVFVIQRSDCVVFQPTKGRHIVISICTLVILSLRKDLLAYIMRIFTKKFRGLEGCTLFLEAFNKTNTVPAAENPASS